MVEMPAIGERVKITTSGPAGTTTHEGVVLPGAAPEHLARAGGAAGSALSCAPGFASRDAQASRPWA